MDNDRRDLIRLIAKTHCINESMYADYTFDLGEQVSDFSYSNKKVLITKNVILDMLRAQCSVLGSMEEYGFFVYGKEIEPNLVVFFKSAESDFYNLRVSRKNLSNEEKYYKKTIMMSEDSIYEILDEALERELPDHSKSIDSILHFHVHSDLNIHPAGFSVKDICLYSRILPSINEDLDIMGETHRLKFYGALMCPNTVKHTIDLHVVYPKCNDFIKDCVFKFENAHLYQLSEDGTEIAKIRSDGFMTYQNGFIPDQEKNSHYRINAANYDRDISGSIHGKSILNKVKQYSKKTKW